MLVFQHTHRNIAVSQVAFEIKRSGNQRPHKRPDPAQCQRCRFERNLCVDMIMRATALPRSGPAPQHPAEACPPRVHWSESDRSAVWTDKPVLTDTHTNATTPGAKTKADSQLTQAHLYSKLHMGDSCCCDTSLQGSQIHTVTNTQRFPLCLLKRRVIMTAEGNHTKTGEVQQWQMA